MQSRRLSRRRPQFVLHDNIPFAMSVDQTQLPLLRGARLTQLMTRNVASTHNPVAALLATLKGHGLVEVVHGTSKT